MHNISYEHLYSMSGIISLLSQSTLRMVRSTCSNDTFHSLVIWRVRTKLQALPPPGAAASDPMSGGSTPRPDYPGQSPAPPLQPCQETWLRSEVSTPPRSFVIPGVLFVALLCHVLRNCAHFNLKPGTIIITKHIQYVAPWPFICLDLLNLLSISI